MGAISKLSILKSDLQNGSSLHFYTCDACKGEGKIAIKPKGVVIQETVIKSKNAMIKLSKIVAGDLLSLLWNKRAKYGPEPTALSVVLVAADLMIFIGMLVGKLSDCELTPHPWATWTRVFVSGIPPVSALTYGIGLGLRAWFRSIIKRLKETT